MRYSLLSQARAACLHLFARTMEAKKTMAAFLSAKTNSHEPSEQEKTTSTNAKACGIDKKTTYQSLLRARTAARRTFLVACGAFVFTVLFDSSFLSVLSIFITAFAIAVQAVFWWIDGSTKPRPQPQEVSHG